jgi:N-methylhydantoinase A
VPVSAATRIGVDIGGTFTDIVLLDESGRLRTKKVSSTVDNYARAIAAGLVEAFAEAGIGGGDAGEVLHATTVGSNAILELKGARTGLITTAGFRDVLEIRTLRMPRLYDLHWDKPPPLVERHLRLEVAERVNARGEIETKLDEEAAERAVDRLVQEGVEAIAICFLHAYANPVHERRVREIAELRAPGITICASSDILPEIREYERTSTTVINAYVRPIIERYLATLIADLRRIEVKAPLLLMQSNGGLTTAETASRLPMHVIESGPAAGVIGAQAIARRIGFEKIVTFDMGGTTAKASLVERGEVTRAEEYSVGAGIMVGSRLLSGAGYALKVPAIDLAEVGAGGGSVVWIDPGGAPQVGPHSAGAVPGPVCYGAGGTEPTITDANVVLGYINPAHLVGGALKLDAAKAARVFEEKVARPLGLALERAALGAHQIAASNMIRAIRAVSSERGRDPRGYVLFAFGGNGPLFAAGMARTLGMKRVIVPPSAGVFSSLGLLYSEVEYHYSRTHRRLLADIAPTELGAVYAALESEAAANLTRDGFTGRRAEIRRSAKLRYQGQSYELPAPVESGPVTAATIAALAEAFAGEHERTYGHRAGKDEPIELINIQVLGRGHSERPRVPDTTTLATAFSVPRGTSRRAYFGAERGWLETPVIARTDLASSRPGPLIVEEYDATCLIPPGAEASLDRYGNIQIEVP